jgi:hypothetical protein
MRLILPGGATANHRYGVLILPPADYRFPLFREEIKMADKKHDPIFWISFFTQDEQSAYQQVLVNFLSNLDTSLSTI